VKNNILLLAFLLILAISIYILIEFATFSGHGATGIPIFGVKVPTLFSSSLEVVDTELNIYSSLINDLLIISGALLGFYSLVVIEVIKAMLKAVTLLKRMLPKIVIIITTLFLVISIYLVLFFSIINASTAATAQGNVDTYSCMRIITLAQINLSTSNKTTGEANCFGVVTQITVLPSKQTTAALYAQLGWEVDNESKAENALFENTLNSTVWLESVFFMLPFLLLVYTLNLYLAYQSNLTAQKSKK